MKIPREPLLLALVVFVNFCDGTDPAPGQTESSRERDDRRQSNPSTNPASANGILGPHPLAGLRTQNGHLHPPLLLQTRTGNRGSIHYARYGGLLRYHQPDPESDERVAEYIILRDRMLYGQRLRTSQATPSSSGATAASPNQPSDDPPEDLFEDSIEIEFKDGFCYDGRFKYNKFLPTWLHGLQEKDIRIREKRNNNFLALIVTSKLYGEAEVFHNAAVKRKPVTGETSVRIRIGKDKYYETNPFQVYTLENRNHGIGLESLSSYYPEKNYLYINVPEDEKPVVYRARLKKAREPLKRFS